MRYRIQDPSEYGTITSESTLTNIGTISAHDDSIDSSNSDAERKKAEALCKVKPNDTKVKSAAE